MSIRFLRGLGASLIVIAASGCGGGEAATTSSTPTASTVGDTITDGGPLDFLVASDSAKDCFMAAVTSATTDEMARLAFDCLTDDEVIATQRRYLELETEATTEQVDCVEQRLRDLGAVGMRDAVFSGIGQAAYVPCGLPD